MPEDPRAVLGLPLDATRSEAQRAFRRLAKQTHPDVGGDAAAFRAVAHAWAELAPVIAPQPPPMESRPAPPAPHVAAYRVAMSRVVWAEPRPSACAAGAGRAGGFSVASCRSGRHNATGKSDFAAILEAEMARVAA